MSGVAVKNRRTFDAKARVPWWTMSTSPRQVFGLAGFLLTPASQSLLDQCLVGAFAPAYRCATVPECHRIPFWRNREWLISTPGATPI